MICPHCGRSCVLPTNTLLNMESYMKPCVTVTMCCGHAVTAVPSMSYRVAKYEGPDRVDDWARPIKRSTT